MTIGAKTPAGMLEEVSGSCTMREKFRYAAYFSKNTHLQIEDWLMVPPRIGPSNKDKE